MPKPQRIVYVDKPVFAKPDPNDPIRYILRPQSAQEQAEIKPEPQRFNKLAEMMGMPNRQPASVVKEDDPILDGQVNKLVADRFKEGPEKVEPEEWLEMNKEYLGPALFDRLRTEDPSRLSANQYRDLYKSIMEQPGLTPEMEDAFQGWHNMYGPQDFEDPYDPSKRK